MHGQVDDFVATVTRGGGGGGGRGYQNWPISAYNQDPFLSAV